MMEQLLQMLMQMGLAQPGRTPQGLGKYLGPSTPIAIGSGGQHSPLQPVANQNAPDPMMMDAIQRRLGKGKPKDMGVPSGGIGY